MAERRLAGEEPSRERLVDDADPGSAFAIVRRESAARGQRDAHQTEVAVADDPEVGNRPLWQRKNRTAANAVWRTRVEAGERQSDGDRRVCDARLRAQVLYD